MTTTAVLDGQRQTDWDAFVLRHPGTIAWHLFNWSHVLETYHGATFYPLVALEGDAIRGILPLYRIQTWRTGAALVSIPYVVAGGIVSDHEEAEHALLDQAIRLSQSQGAIPVALKQYGHRVAGDLRTDEGYYNLELSIRDGAQSVWNSLAPYLREEIEGVPGPVTLDYPSTDVATFHRALARHQRAGGVPAPSRRWINLLLGTGFYQMALLRRGNQVLAGTLLKVFRGTASFPYTCVAQRGPTGDPLARRLYWELIQRLTQEGFEIVHSGRIPANQDVPAYRLGWGGQRRDYFYQYHGLQGKTESGSKRGRSRSLVEAVWRRLPLPLTNLLSQPVLRQYP